MFLEIKIVMKSAHVMSELKVCAAKCVPPDTSVGLLVCPGESVLGGVGGAGSMQPLSL